MIRDAKFQDVPELLAMLREMQAASKYAGRVEVVDKVAEALLMGLIAGQRQTGPQASFCAVAEQDGIVGFMAGVLDRVYHIGDRLVANDAYLYVRPKARAAHSLRLIDAYIRWATGNPKVIEVKLSWTDVLPGAERIGELYGRKGFHKIGEIYEMRLDAPEQQEAA